MTEFNIDELIRILPQLIKENDTIKGAIITALSGIMPTREDFQILTEQIRQSFKKMDERFEKMDERFEKMDERFDKMDQRFDKMDERFDKMDERFDKMDERFEKMDERFAKMDERFAKMDERFDELNTKMEMGFAQLRDALKILNVSINRIESKEGELIEKLILNLLKESFVIENVNPENIQKLNLVDKEGSIFYPNYRTDVDIIAENGNVYLFEIKATADRHDIAHFMQNIKLYKKQTGKEVIQAYIVALRMKSESYELALNLGMKVIKGELQD